MVDVEPLQRACPLVQVAALPPPDAKEIVAMGDELHIMEAVLHDLQERLEAEGYHLGNADKQAAAADRPLEAIASAAQRAVAPSGTGNAHAQCMPPGLLDTGALNKSTNTEGSQAEEPSSSQRDAAAQHAEQAMFCGTDRSLADMDAVMQARGYR